MIRIRRYFLSVAPILIAIFSMLLMASHIAGSYDGNTDYSIVDFEDTNESSEEAKPFKLIEDYNLQKINLLSLQQNYMLSANQYRRFAVEHSLEVFIEVVTPPPEA